MTIVLWKTLRPFITAHINRCPGIELDTWAREAAREFFRRSHSWRARDLTLLTTVADQSDYTYASPPAQGEVLQVMAAWDEAGDREVHVSLPGENDDEDPSENDTTWTIAAVPGTNTLRLSPLPETADVVITGSLSFMPTPTATGLDDTIYNRWYRHIASGAVAMLASQPDKPWSNAAIVAYHQSMFYAAISQASNEAGPARRKPLRVKPW